MADKEKKNYKEFYIIGSVLGGALLLCLIIILIASSALDYSCRINEFKEFKNLPKEPARIVYSVTDTSGETVAYEIADAEQVKQVIDLLFDRKYIRSGKEPIDGSYLIKVYDNSGKAWNVPIGAIKGKNGYYYEIKDDDGLGELLKTLVGAP